jgi:TonB family protein
VAPPQQVIPAIEPPKIELPASTPPVVAGIVPSPVPPVAAPPPPPPPEKPKLAFESVGAPAPRTAPNPNAQVPMPNNSVQQALRNPLPSGGGGGGIVVGDIGTELNPVPGINQPETAGRVGSNLQLLSDAKGVDFKPYLVQVLQSVRRNWMAIIPESARMGRRGRVLIQFIIDKQGGVPKLVIAEASGTEALDRAAVAGISASYPFPPLPANYQGDQIRLQLAFSYNIPNR